jgi:murein DD-endopeptidase MepM/ murein hydrolase activator NlpD
VARLRLALIVAAVAAVVAAVPAAIGDPAVESPDARIDRLRDSIEEAKQREEILTSDLSAASERIDVVDAQAQVVGARLDELEAELAEHRGRLAELRELYALETKRLKTLRRAERVAQHRLEQRIVDIYVNDPPDELEILFQVRSLNDLISQLDYLDQIARRDQEIADDVALASDRIADTRRRLAETKAAEARTTALLATRTAEQRRSYARLVGYRDELVAAQADRRALLTRIRDDRHEAEEDLAGLEQASAELAARLQSNAPLGPPPAPSASGFIWPVNGPVTSGYGLRWGRLHAGVDIGVGFGTPIRAAAAGTVSYAGWLGGYGNLVVVEHGGGLATAYAHQQRIYASVGQTVAQGDVLGEVGSTGNSTGPHLHFEVRINGTAVDPLGYL